MYVSFTKIWVFKSSCKSKTILETRDKLHLKVQFVKWYEQNYKYYKTATSNIFAGHANSGPHTEKVKGNTYLKYRESNVEILDQASVPLVRLLHEWHQHVFFIWSSRTVTG